MIETFPHSYFNEIMRKLILMGKAEPTFRVNFSVEAQQRFSKSHCQQQKSPDGKKQHKRRLPRINQLAKPISGQRRFGGRNFRVATATVCVCGAPDLRLSFLTDLARRLWRHKRSNNNREISETPV